MLRDPRLRHQQLSTWHPEMPLPSHQACGRLSSEPTCRRDPGPENAAPRDKRPCLSSPKAWPPPPVNGTTFQSTLIYLSVPPSNKGHLNEGLRMLVYARHTDTEWRTGWPGPPPASGSHVGHLIGSRSALRQVGQCAVTNGPPTQGPQRQNTDPPPPIFRLLPLQHMGEPICDMTLSVEKPSTAVNN